MTAVAETDASAPGDTGLVSGASSEPSLHPNKSSGDIVERLRAAESILGKKPCEVYRLRQDCADAATEIERLRREVGSFRETLRIERDCRLNETRLKDQYRDRALTAESAVAAAWEALRPFAEASEYFGEGAPDDFDIWDSEAATMITVGDLRRASAIRAASGGTKDA